jgi:hypothetical protein
MVWCPLASGPGGAWPHGLSCQRRASVPTVLALRQAARLESAPGPRHDCFAGALPNRW